MSLRNAFAKDSSKAETEEGYCADEEDEQATEIMTADEVRINVITINGNKSSEIK